MRHFVTLLLLLAGAARAWADTATPTDVWAGYLDYAYVYTSADAASLRERLAQYGREAGMPLDDYVVRHLATETLDPGLSAETRDRRLAIAHLLRYLAEGEPNALEASAEAIRRLEDRLGRHENDYWYHYILAQRALEKGHRFDFVGHVLDLWLEVVVPLETPYETLRALSLSESANSGFVSALPYVYENISRLVLIRGPSMGMDRDLDPLGAVVRLLADGRVGGQPDVIPREATSRAYLDRIIERLEGPESDAGSLTFTLALFEASKLHDQARALLASEGLSAQTIEAIRMASGAYATALERADTVQGQCAVTVRALRQLGEIYAAKQRLGVDPEVESPFSLEGAIEVYAKLFDGRDGGWPELGYARSGREAYIQAMHGLWEEIQETSLNAADYYLSRSLEVPHLADENSRDAARIYARYLAFFRKYATPDGQEAVPDSAYFAAYEAGRGFGDALIAYGRSAPTEAEMKLATHRYLEALRLFPFDRTLWSALTTALDRQGRQNEYLSLVRPIAEEVTRSRALDTWLENDESEASRITALRSGLSESLAILHLGFADAGGVAELEQDLADLRVQRGELATHLAELSRERELLSAGRGDALPAAAAGLPDVSAGGGEVSSARQLAALDVQIVETSRRLDDLDRQIQARERALPLYKKALTADGLADVLRARRDHPVHTLLRRMYYERARQQT